MWIADLIGARAGGCNTVTDARVVAKIGAVRHSERSASLGNGDARELPTTEHLVSQSPSLKERETVDVANRQTVALIEARVSAILANIEGIDEIIVKAIRRIVDSVAVGVSEAQCQIAHCATR